MKGNIVKIIILLFVTCTTTFTIHASNLQDKKTYQTKMGCMSCHQNITEPVDAELKKDKKTAQQKSAS